MLEAHHCHPRTGIRVAALEELSALAVHFEWEVKKQYCLVDSVQSSVQHMPFAKQRFDSTAKPLGRCLLNLDAVISTMNIVCGEHPTTSKEHRGAAEFLHAVSQEANLILLGMLADASDECLLLTRLLDKEAFRL